LCSNTLQQNQPSFETAYTSSDFRENDGERSALFEGDGSHSGQAVCLTPIKYNSILSHTILFVSSRGKYLKVQSAHFQDLEVRCDWCA